MDWRMVALHPICPLWFCLDVYLLVTLKAPTKEGGGLCYNHNMSEATLLPDKPVNLVPLYVLSTFALFISLGLSCFLVFYLLPNIATLESDFSTIAVVGRNNIVGGEQLSSDEQLDEIENRLSMVENTITTRNEVAGTYILRSQNEITLILHSSGGFVLETEKLNQDGLMATYYLARGTWVYSTEGEHVVVLHPDCSLASEGAKEGCNRFIDMMFTPKGVGDNVVLTEVKSRMHEYQNLVFDKNLWPSP
jgi:hypothetical protein